MSTGKKFLELPRHPLDVKRVRHAVKAINALKNAKIVNPNGQTIGEIHFADGNTVFEIYAASALKVLKYDSTKSWAKGAALAKVRVDDDAVVTGITISGIVYKATPGKWIATQDVPTPPTLPAHIPSFDTRADNDPENPANFWDFVTPATICLPGQDAIEI